MGKVPALREGASAQTGNLQPETYGMKVMVRDRNLLLNRGAGKDCVLCVVFETTFGRFWIVVHTKNFDYAVYREDELILVLEVTH